MAFAYRFVLSPWAQEYLYTKMVEQGFTSFHAFLVDKMVEAAESPMFRERAFQLAEAMEEVKYGGH